MKNHRRISQTRDGQRIQEVLEVIGEGLESLYLKVLVINKTGKIRERLYEDKGKKLFTFFNTENMEEVLLTKKERKRKCLQKKNQLKRFQ